MKRVTRDLLVSQARLSKNVTFSRSPFEEAGKRRNKPALPEECHKIVVFLNKISRVKVKTLLVSTESMRTASSKVPESDLCKTFATEH